ncbi:hypothetical protein LR48_Vigan07g196600 [Vigna angularis]|uniref:Ubiquitin-like protease family profile domain-containing protein n=1 Tax=Phaseolus angularis TaxID=3914 RepID=A0A0L9V074_PHAAN|nr:hypothetical protein LR48_Vigan07g196600 [Vigna angularis]
MRKRRAEELGLESPDLAPPPARHELWKAARTKSNGQFTSQSAQEISQRILQVYRPEKQPIAQLVNEAREEAEDHDAISILTSRLNKLRKGSVEMLWELRTFGLECHVPLYINFDDAYEIIGRASVYGFLEPQTIQPSGNTLDSRKSYIETWMTESNRERYIAPYIDAGHWQLMVIIPKKEQVVWFCSLHRKIKAELKSLIQTYYIMSWMKAIIRAEIRGEWTKRLNTTSPLSTLVITTIR